MKKHAIIPIFIPHRGCPNDCVFCNQRKITARQDTVTLETARQTIETWLSTLEPRLAAKAVSGTCADGSSPCTSGGIETIEVAFFGGSFTGIPLEEQSAFLAVAKEYKDAGRIHHIHLSTRPDYINEEILDNLKKYDVDVIELGVQSLDDRVLKAAGRGHDAAAVYRASDIIKAWGFTLGIQLMVGLPGSTLETEIYSAKETVCIAPAIARLYPTVILPETVLHAMYLSGRYVPLSEPDAVHRTKEMYKILHAAGINIIRVGLKSSDIMTGSHGGAAGTFHPAFRQLVEGAIAREELERQVNKLYPGIRDPHDDRWKFCPACLFVSTEKDRNNLFGHKSTNKEYFAQEYRGLNIEYVTDKQAGLTLRDGEYRVVDLGPAYKLHSIKEKLR